MYCYPPTKTCTCKRGYFYKSSEDGCVSGNKTFILLYTKKRFRTTGCDRLKSRKIVHKQTRLKNSNVLVGIQAIAI